MVVIFLWFLSFAIGPRIEISGLPADLRIQEIVFIPLLILVFLVLDVRTRVSGQKAPDQTALTLWVSVFLFVISALAIVFLGVSSPDVIVSLGFLLRYFEMVFTGLLIARVVQPNFRQGLAVSFVGLTAGLVLNLGWLTTQLIMGFSRPAISFSSTIPSMYGPGLIGEGGVFGTGQYLSMIAALLIAFLSMNPPPQSIVPAAGLLALVVFFQLEVNSRASILSTVAMLIFLLVTQLSSLIGAVRMRSIALIGLIFGALSTVAIAWFLPRLRPEPVIAAIKLRFDVWHTPILQALEDNFAIGLGPGGSRLAARGESHSMYFMIFGDFGAVGLIVFFATVTFLLVEGRRSMTGQRRWSAKFLGLSVVLITLNLLLVGIVQDALLPVNTTHLFFSLVGLYFAARIDASKEITQGRQLSMPVSQVLERRFRN